jgi:hypothetical protein
VQYPAGHTLKLSFDESELSVYDREAVILVPLTAAASATNGARTLKGTLGFQACNDQVCLVPARIPFELSVTVAGGVAGGTTTTTAPGTSATTAAPAPDTGFALAPLVSGPGAAAASALNNPIAKLFERGSLCFLVVVVTPGHDFEHLSSHISLPFPGSIETAQSAPVFMIDHSGLRRRSVPIAVENMKQATGVFENIGANRQRDVVDGEKFVPHGSKLLHAAGGKTDIRPVILDEETGRAAREPAKEKHVPVVTIIARPCAATAFVIAQKLLGAIRDRHRLPIRRLGRPCDSPGLESSRLRFVGAIPNLGTGFGKEGQRQKAAENQSWHAKSLP